MSVAQPVEGLLRTLGPSLSSHVAKRFRADGVSSEAARQRILRAGAPVRRLAGIRFPHGERFLYLDEHFRKPLYWERLIQALDDSHSVYGQAIRAIEARGGIVPRRLFRVFSGIPARMKKQISYRFAIHTMLSAGLIEEYDSAILGHCFLLPRNYECARDSEQRIRGRLLAEDLLLRGLSEWLRKLGLVSYNKIETRIGDRLPRFGQFRWDLVGPSYIYPMVSSYCGSRKPGFITADLLLGRTLLGCHTRYFRHKYVAMRAQQNTRPFLAMLVADAFSKEALTEGRGAGIVMATPGNLFGEELGAAFRVLIDTVSNAAAAVTRDPERLYELLDKLSKIEGAAGNVRGALFEFLVGYCVKRVEGGSIDIGVTAQDVLTGGKAEIDVLLVKGRALVHCYECKGYLPTSTITLDDVKKWRSERVPVMLRWLQDQERFRDAHKVFAFWTSATIGSEAVEYLKSAARETRKYTIQWKAGSEVEKYFRDARERRMMQAYRDHYSKHPLSRT